jgi:HlyD family secretion protein
MGHFEADEITLMSETSGRIISMKFKEGDKIRTGDTVAITDTVTASLQIRQLKAQQEAVRSKIPTIQAQERIVDKEISVLTTEKERFSKLVDEQAATSKSLDDIRNQIELAKVRKTGFKPQINSLMQEMEVFKAQEALLAEQLKKCFIISKTSGTILDLIANESEIVVPGRAIMKIADLENIILKAYISGDQLATFSTGQSVTVRIDKPDKEYYAYKGMVYWVSDQAEFTPKVIQTKKERVNLVYAVKVRIQNDGRIKIGMPGELLLNHE